MNRNELIHPADIYNKARAIVFSTFNKDGVAKAYKVLELQNHLPYPSWLGLKAELDFYSKYFSKYNLEIAADYGQKFDFIGVFNNNICRIDVTTNIEYKKLETYEPFQKKEGRKYKIAVMNKDNGALEDIIDLNFPFDKTGNGRIFEILLLMPSPSETDDEDLKYNFLQKVISISNLNPTEEYNLEEVVTDYHIKDFDFLFDMFEHYAPYVNEKAIIQQHSIDSAKLINREKNRNIVAVAGRNFILTNPKEHEGYYGTKFYWKHPLITNYLNEVIDIDFSIES